jgi:hypothetical protein
MTGAVRNTKKLLFIDVWPESEFAAASDEEIEIKLEYEAGYLGSLGQIEMARRHLAARAVQYVAD